MDLVHCQRYHVMWRISCESQVAWFALCLLAMGGGAQVGETVFWHLHLQISGGCPARPDVNAWDLISAARAAPTHCGRLAVAALDMYHHHFCLSNNTIPPECEVAL